MIDITRKEAQQIAGEILKVAEQERIDAANREAQCGIQWLDGVEND